MTDKLSNTQIAALQAMPFDSYPGDKKGTHPGNKLTWASLEKLGLAKGKAKKDGATSWSQTAAGKKLLAKMEPAKTTKKAA